MLLRGLKIVFVEERILDLGIFIIKTFMMWNLITLTNI